MRKEETFQRREYRGFSMTMMTRKRRAARRMRRTARIRRSSGFPPGFAVEYSVQGIPSQMSQTRPEPIQRRMRRRTFGLRMSYWSPDLKSKGGQTRSPRSAQAEEYRPDPLKSSKTAGPLAMQRAGASPSVERRERKSSSCATRNT